MLIKVTVSPGSSEDRIEQVSPDTYHICVKAGPQHGHANKVVTALLARHFGTSARMVSGGTRTHKIFRIG